MLCPSVIPEPSSACFDDLPNELLGPIVSFIIDPPVPRKAQIVEYRDENGNDHRISQQLVLMHVSSRFRRAVLRAKFWHHHDFEFDQIMGFGDPSTDGQIRRDFIYRHLFAQDDLLQNLETKSDWTILRPELFVHILSSLPNFLTTVRRLSLFFGKEFDFAFRRLRPCQLLQLELGGYPGRYDFSQVGKLNLKSLELKVPETHLGNLHGLIGLERLQIETVEVDFSSDAVRIPHDVLPLASANTLTFLEITGYAETDYSLKAFPNLDTLGYYIWPYDLARDSFFEVLLSCASPIRCLNTQFVLHPAENVSAMAEYQSSIFVLPCLQNLKELHLLIATDFDFLYEEPPLFGNTDAYVGLCMDIVETLAGSLLSLEKLVIKAGLDVFRKEPLGNLKMLKKLSWSVGTGALRGVAIGSDLTQCIPTWFPEYVEHVHVSIAGYLAMMMRGRKVVGISRGADVTFHGNEESD
jgi:hypothetical protein